MADGPDTGHGEIETAQRSGVSRRATLGWLSGAVLLSAACARNTPARPADPASRITEGRQRIDELDGQIIDLIRQRVDVSHQVQQTRESAGGQHTDPRREQVIVTRYQTALGPSGPEIARAILDAARGRQP